MLLTQTFVLIEQIFRKLPIKKAVCATTRGLILCSILTRVVYVFRNVTMK